MEENQVTSQTATPKSSYILPTHSNRMAMSIICTLFCCLIGGIIAIVNSSKSNNLYNSAMLSNDDSMKQNLYYQSEASNKTAKTWIIISLICGVIYVIVLIILAAIGVLADLF